MLKRELEELVAGLRAEVGYLNELIVGRDAKLRDLRYAKTHTDEDLTVTKERLKACEKTLGGAGKTIKTMHNTIVISAIREATGQVVEVNPDAKA